jgi:hypothetical protein
MVAARPDGLLKQDIGGLQETVSFTPQSEASPGKGNYAPCASP